MSYSIICDDRDPVNQYPALLAIVPTGLASAWVGFFRENEAQRLQKQRERLHLSYVPDSTIKAEEITDENQIADVLAQGMRRARWLPEMPEMLRRAAVDANRALQGLEPLPREDAWWRKPPEQAMQTPEGYVLLPWLMVEDADGVLT